MWSLRTFPTRLFHSSSAPVLHSLHALLYLLVEFHFLLVVEYGANLCVRVLRDLHGFAPHFLTVPRRIVSQVLHLFLHILQNRLDFRLLVGGQFEILRHLLQTVVGRHRPSPALSASGPSLFPALRPRGPSASHQKRNTQQ